MARIIGAILLVALVFAVFKLALILLVVAGLIFRTRQTVALLLLGGLLSLISVHPLAGLGLLAIVAVAALVNVARRQSSPGAALRLRIERDLNDPAQE